MITVKSISIQTNQITIFQLAKNPTFWLDQNFHIREAAGFMLFLHSISQIVCNLQGCKSAGANFQCP